MPADASTLRKAIGREEFDHVLLSSILCETYSQVPQKITKLLRSGTIIRVKKGLYVFGPHLRQHPICKETLANLIYGPSCISLEYALSFHGLIPERVETITSVTPKKNKEFDTPVGRFSYRYLGADRYPHGIEQQWLDKQHPILIASPEKALCDYLELKDVPRLKSSKAARAFLREDLRIDEEDWHRFDIKKMLGLNKHYKNPNITAIMEVL
jgi:hypothetical protein